MVHTLQRLTEKADKVHCNMFQNILQVINILLALTKLDGNPVIRDSGEMEEEEVDDDSDSSELDEELYNDPATQEIIKTLVL